GFFSVDETMRDLTQAPEYILETFDETFQVERRVLDSLLSLNAQHVGVKVIQGATVLADSSNFSSEGNLLLYKVGGKEYRVRASLVVDASGPTGVLSSHF